MPVRVTTYIPVDGRKVHVVVISSTPPKMVLTLNLLRQHSCLITLMGSVSQQFKRPLAGHCKYRIQSRIRVDNETCIHDHRNDETAPSESVREFH